MKRATVTITDELEPVLDEYLRSQDVAPALTALVQAALSEFLSRRGYGAAPKKLQITPAPQGSGVADVSLHHDQYLAEP